MSFLPSNYKSPSKPSRYMKFKTGLNKFRIMSPAVTGYEYWNINNKPVRSKEPFKYIPEDIKIENGRPSSVKHFWAFVVWDYLDSKIKILQITQSTVQQGIRTGVDLRDGNADKNDIGVSKTGEGIETEYSVQFADPTPVPPEAEAAFKAEKIDLEALFTGGDPFGSSNPTERGVDKRLGGVTEDYSVEDIPF